MTSPRKTGSRRKLTRELLRKLRIPLENHLPKWRVSRY
jgi:hypothetical protein